MTITAEILKAIIWFCVGWFANQIFTEWERRKIESNKVWKPTNRKL